ncbi:hypothetical protein VB712_02340 [Spirulina sp. CCNP1310]|nr:hypothetical protein [Spirulina sp. CCNP1310]
MRPKTMQVWVAIVVLLFIGAQFVDWLMTLTLPWPLYGVAGVLLAIASNRRFSPSLPPVEPEEARTPPPPQPSISFRINP